MRATGRARVNPRAPSAFGVCDNCGMWYNRAALVDEMQYQGNAVRPTGFKVCTRTCMDVPQPQLASPVLPSDPKPVLQPRPELYTGDNGFGLASSGSASSSANPVSEMP
jgi:hypothetical protein